MPRTRGPFPGLHRRGWGLQACCLLHAATGSGRGLTVNPSREPRLPLNPGRASLHGRTRCLHTQAGCCFSPACPWRRPEACYRSCGGGRTPQHRPWSAALATALLLRSRELWRPLSAVPCSGSAWTARGGGPWLPAVGRALRGRTPLGRPLALRRVWFQAQRTMLTDVKVELEPALGTCTRLGSPVGPRGPGRSPQPWALTWTPWFCTDHALSPGFSLPACRDPPGVPPPEAVLVVFPGEPPSSKRFLLCGQKVSGLCCPSVSLFKPRNESPCGTSLAAAPGSGPSFVPLAACPPSQVVDIWFFPRVLVWTEWRWPRRAHRTVGEGPRLFPPFRPESWTWASPGVLLGPCLSNLGAASQRQGSCARPRCPLRSKGLRRVRAGGSLTASPEQTNHERTGQLRAQSE